MLWKIPSLFHHALQWLNFAQSNQFDLNWIRIGFKQYENVIHFGNLLKRLKSKKEATISRLEPMRTGGS